MLGRFGPAASPSSYVSTRLNRCVGDNITRARTCKKMSRTDLGHAINIEETLVANYEAGLEKVSPTMLHRIAVTLDVTLGSSFGLPGL